MPKIFISYRRADTGDLVDRFTPMLRNHFGEENVVRDKDNFDLGVDFRQSIYDGLVQSDIVLVPIGEFWYSIMNERAANKTPDSEPDYVMEEIKIALRENKPMIPLLVDDAGIPPAIVLPEEIKTLAYCEGVEVSSSRHKLSWDISRLIRRIEKQLGVANIPRPGTDEYVYYLLDEGQWHHTILDGLDAYGCNLDNEYCILVDIHSPDRRDEYEAEWTENLVGRNRVYPVHIQRNGQPLPGKTVYFVSLRGGKILVPSPHIDGTADAPIFYWDVFSLEMKIARHIALLQAPRDSFEKFAELANIEIRE